jgi:hypothetical protein
MTRRVKKFGYVPSYRIRAIDLVEDEAMSIRGPKIIGKLWIVVRDDKEFVCRDDIPSSCIPRVTNKRGEIAYFRRKRDAAAIAHALAILEA